MSWEIVYKKAYNEDGSLFFPEKISEEFLARAKRSMGIYIWTNQYLNEIIPKELQNFKKEWLRYYDELPKDLNKFVFIDPALSEGLTSDNTGIVVVGVDPENKWYVLFAQRFRVTPTQLIDRIFTLNKIFQPQVIGIEEVAYQKALLYFLDDEMRRRNVILPVTGIKPPTGKAKSLRILSMVPRFEWGRIFLARGLGDLEIELMQFPRGSHDDVIDALAYIEYIAYPATVAPKWAKAPHVSHPDYETYYINQLAKGKKNNEQE